MENQERNTYNPATAKKTFRPATSSQKPEPTSGSPAPNPSDTAKPRAKTCHDLEIWRQGMDLAAATWNAFRDCSQPELRRAAEHAAFSIPSRIAEGFEKQRQEDFLPYLSHARGAAAQLHTAVELARRLQAVAPEKLDLLTELQAKLGGMMYKFMQACRSSARPASP